MSLFSWILSIIFSERVNQRTIAQLSTETALSLLTPKEVLTSTQEVVTALLPYTHETVRALIREAKFHANTKAQEILGTILAEYLRDVLAEDAVFLGNVVIIPVPLSRSRARERGYNQVERVLSYSKKLLPELVVDTTVIKRTRDTKPQTSLKANERRGNLRDAFRVTKTCNHSVTYIIIDDVTTTGTTLSEVTKTLHEAGASHILSIALAH